MKTTFWTRKQFRQLAGIGTMILAACAANAQTADGPTKAPAKAEASADNSSDTDELDNWIELGGGYNFVSGSKANYQTQSGEPARGFGGITGFHYETPVAKKGEFSIDGRGI